MKALIFENKVTDVQETEFPVNSSFVWVDCPDNVKIGFDYDGTNFTDPDVLSDEVIAEQKALLKSKTDGNKKLLDLGLSQAEATALTGFKPEE